MAEDKLDKELATIKADMNKLRGDLSDLMGLYKELGKEKAAGARQSFNEEVNKRGQQARESWSSAKAQGEKGVESVESEIVSHPLGAVATAFGVGFIVAKLLGSGGRH